MWNFVLLSGFIFSAFLSFAFALHLLLKRGEWPRLGAGRASRTSS